MKGFRLLPLAQLKVLKVRKKTQRLSKEEFSCRGGIVHNGFYDYSKVVYKNSKIKVTVGCPLHGDFDVKPSNHLAGSGCPTCGRLKSDLGRAQYHKSLRPDLSHIETPPGSKAVPVGTNGDYTLVDNEDYDRVMEYSWYLSAGGYVFNKEVGFMHRFIMYAPKDKVVDHIFHDKLDNRKAKLRLCTPAQNSLNIKKRENSSGYKGVSWHKASGKWRVVVRIDGSSVHIGLFEDKEVAARAYDNVVKKYHKDFAYLNFPQ